MLLGANDLPAGLSVSHLKKAPQMHHRVIINADNVLGDSFVLYNYTVSSNQNLIKQ